MLEQYLAKLTQPQKLPPKRKKQLIAAGIAAAACLVFLTARVVNLQSELSGVRNTVNNLSNQLSYVQNSVANIDTNITDRVQNALNEEYGLLTNYDLKLVDVDYQANTARLLFTGVLRETPADPDALSFYLLWGGRNLRLCRRAELGRRQRHLYRKDHCAAGGWAELLF